jgi:hypothetical protein
MLPLQNACVECKQQINAIKQDSVIFACNCRAHYICWEERYNACAGYKDISIRCAGCYASAAVREKVAKTEEEKADPRQTKRIRY